VKIGVEDRKKLWVAVGLTVVAVLVFFFSIGGSAPTPARPVATTTATVEAPVPTARPTVRPKAHGKKASGAPRSLDPTLRYDWLKASEDTEYAGNGRNIFQAQAEIQQPLAPVKTADEMEAEKRPPPPPPPPPINLKFFGFANKAGEPKKIFLSEGEDVFIAAEGDVVNRHYKVVRISPTSVEIEDVLNNNRQSIPLTLG
jgi:hypothetical protein